MVILKCYNHILHYRQTDILSDRNYSSRKQKCSLLLRDLTEAELQGLLKSMKGSHVKAVEVGNSALDEEAKARMDELYFQDGYTLTFQEWEYTQGTFSCDTVNDNIVDLKTKIKYATILY